MGNIIRGPMPPVGTYGLTGEIRFPWSEYDPEAARVRVVFTRSYFRWPVDGYDVGHPGTGYNPGESASLPAPEAAALIAAGVASPG